MKISSVRQEDDKIDEEWQNIQEDLSSGSTGTICPSIKKKQIWMTDEIS